MNGCDIADAYLNAELGSGYEWWNTGIKNERGFCIYENLA